jgi:hypothetical protein
MQDDQTPIIVKDWRKPPADYLVVMHAGIAGLFTLNGRPLSRAEAREVIETLTRSYDQLGATEEVQA